MLLKYKADPNLQNNSLRTAVHYGIMHCTSNTGVIYALVQYGGSLYLKDQQNNTPLDYIQSEEVRKAINILKTQCDTKTLEPVSAKKENDIRIESKINHQFLLQKQASLVGGSSFRERQDSFKVKGSEERINYSNKGSSNTTTITFSRFDPQK